jgi:hypothetical protein
MGINWDTVFSTARCSLILNGFISEEVLFLRFKLRPSITMSKSFKLSQRFFNMMPKRTRLGFDLGTDVILEGPQT